MARKPASTDVQQLQELLLWARRERIVLGQVVVGTVQCTVTDLGIAPPKRKPRKDQESDLYNVFAPGLRDELAAAGLPTGDDDDDATAVQ